MNQEQIRELFLQGIDCSQVVTETFADRMRMDRKQARKIASCFGGGMMDGETCGAVTGALMVIGMLYGHSENGDAEQKAIMMKKAEAFKSLFLEKHPSCICKKLLGYDISNPAEKKQVLEKGLLLELCPAIVEDTIQILNKIL